MVRRGLIRTKDEIKYLVLYAMQYVEYALSFEAILDICTWCDDGFSYFDLREAFSELVDTKHVEQQDEGYLITQLGRDAAQVFESNLPFPIREAAQASAIRVIRKLRRDAAITSAVEECDTQDFIVHLCMEGVFSVDMHVVSRAQAAMLERSFKSNAETIYHVLLETMVSPPDQEKEE